MAPHPGRASQWPSSLEQGGPVDHDPEVEQERGEHEADGADRARKIEVVPLVLEPDPLPPFNVTRREVDHDLGVDSEG